MSVALAAGAALVGLGFAAYFAKNILSLDEGSAKMKEISGAIRQGAMAFLKRQYVTITALSVVLAVLIAFLIKPANVGVMTAVSFLIGAFFSGFAGFLSMWVAVRANGRTARAAEKGGLNAALQASFRGGAVMGLCVVALSLLSVSALYLIFGKPEYIIGLAFGASFVALFAQLGGGIYTKAADVGADLVGKIEKNIPEDDPRNPAVIADNVGDNVGDCAGRGADLFESCTAENIGAMILGVALMPVYGMGGVLFPLVATGMGILASIVGIFFVKVKSNKDNPLKAMDTGLYVTSAISAVGLFFLVKYFLNGNMNLYYASLIGIATSIAIRYITEYYTAKNFGPVQEIARASQTGAATNFLRGISIGLESTSAPILVMCAAILGSYALGSANGAGFSGGIYGTAVATVGMLSSAVFILAMDGYGPISDNAGGIGEMAGMSPKVRDEILDPLDSLGNTTKSLTKGYAMGSAALSAFLLFAAYLETTHLKVVDLALPSIFVGAFVGVALPYLFCSFAIRAVGTAAFEMVNEVRRQFKEIKGLMAGKAKPDYAKCVDISTKAALREMVVPGLLVVLTPLVVGVLLGTGAVGGLLIGATMSGIAMALMMNTGGAAWDNAKKYIESGQYGGKGSPAHAAAVAGDTVGDPFKDTAGPSLHVLVKLLNTISLVFAPVFIGLLIIH